MSEARLTACHGKAAALIIGIFIAGFASGAVGMRVFDRQAPASAEDPVNAQALMAVEELKSALDLDEQQVERLQLILDESIMAEADLLSQIRAIQQDGRDQILEVLNEGQRKKFETMVRQVSSR
jgi:hypothetical protein